MPVGAEQRPAACAVGRGSSGGTPQAHTDRTRLAADTPIHHAAARTHAEQLAAVPTAAEPMLTWNHTRSGKIKQAVPQSRVELHRTCCRRRPRRWGGPVGDLASFRRRRRLRCHSCVCASSKTVGLGSPLLRTNTGKACTKPCTHGPPHSQMHETRILCTAEPFGSLRLLTPPLTR